MRFLGVSLVSFLLSNPLIAEAKTVWSFSDASVLVQPKGAGVGAAANKETFTKEKPITAPLFLGATDTLKLQLTTLEGKTAKRPHQAFLTLQEEKTGLEESFPLNIKENGKGKLDLTQKNLPLQFITAELPLRASIVLGSFGQSTASNTFVFSVRVKQDPTAALEVPQPPVRYGKLPEIHHIFRDDPKSPPIIITLVFTLAALATLPVLIGVWFALGANFNHLQDALNKAPLSHGMFFGSIVTLEGIFFMYYKSWSLFQMLPAVAIVGTVAFVTGSRALTEVQERRLAGKR